MYLEQRIEALEGQVDKLIKLVEELMASPAPAEQAAPTPKAKPVTAEPTPEPAKVDAHTEKSLQDRCLALVRKDPQAKAKIKDILAGYNATLLKHLNAEQLAEVAEAVTLLEAQ
jgi:hypothetical protein